MNCEQQQYNTQHEEWKTQNNSSSYCNTVPDSESERATGGYAGLHWATLTITDIKHYPL